MLLRDIWYLLNLDKFDTINQRQDCIKAEGRHFYFNTYPKSRKNKHFATKFCLK